MVPVLEFSLIVIAAIAALWTAPWRLLAGGSRYELRRPMAIFAISLPLLWWWHSSAALGPVTQLMGSQLALLVLGWPLAVLLFIVAGVAGIAMGAGVGAVIQTVFWCAVLPATLALGLGYAVRVATRAHLMGYLAGRTFVIPLMAVIGAGWFANASIDRYQAWGAAAMPMLMLCALLDAMLTTHVATILVSMRPRMVATWSDALYRPRRKPADTDRGAHHPWRG